MRKLTREWIRKADGDHLVAQQNQRSDTPVPDAVCFHCQQCAEKYLKALLQDAGATPPRTHNLGDMLDLLLPHFPALRSYRRGLFFLTDFAVEPRYPGKRATRRQATAAVRWAGKVREACRALLGLRPPRARRKGP